MSVLTLTLIIITLISKSIGFFRELLLLKAVGVSSELDLFLIYFGFSTFCSGLIGSCVVTNITPFAARNKTQYNITKLTAESIKIGFLASTLLMIWNIIYFRTTLAGHNHGYFILTLSSMLASILFFSVTSEYQVALFLGKNQQLPVICGNIIISLPVVLCMLLWKFTITTYICSLAFSFAFRSTVFWLIIQPSFRDITYEFKKFPFRKPIVLLGFQKTLSGASSMLAVNLLFLISIIFAHDHSVGTATLLGYGMKIPMIILTSVWFVNGSKFFSQIVTKDITESYSLIKKQSYKNTAMTIILFLIIGGFFLFLKSSTLTFTSDSFMQFILYGIPLMPIIIFIPIIEMSQRVLVTSGYSYNVLASTFTSIVISALGFSLFCISAASPIFIIHIITITLFLSACVSLLTVRRLAYQHS